MNVYFSHFSISTQISADMNFLWNTYHHCLSLNRAVHVNTLCYSNVLDVIMSSIAFQELERLKMEQARDVAELMRKKKAIMEEKTTDTQRKSVEDDR